MKTRNKKYVKPAIEVVLLEGMQLLAASTYTETTNGNVTEVENVEFEASDVSFSNASSNFWDEKE